MHITHLGLTNFRNYAEVQIDLPSHVVVLRGDNAQGKSNLLEAVYILATSRSPRAAADRELINWSALEQDLPVCRLTADVSKSGPDVRLELALSAAPGDLRDGAQPPPAEESAARNQGTQKRIRVNGVPRRAVDLVGQLNVVAFTVQDINIIGGPPALRRRYLDVTNAQIDRRYLRALQRYQRVLWQRNRLLRLIARKEADTDQLSFWDRELLETGTYLMEQRHHTVSGLDELAKAIHRELDDDDNALTISYLRSIDREIGSEQAEDMQLPESFARALEEAREKEIAQGMTLVGPHRDDLRFLAEGIDLGVYGSRGQQRVAALALKLAQARYMLHKTEEHPVLLLDDVLSELDARHRTHLLRSVATYQQVLMTATDLDHFEAEFLEGAALMEVSGGRIEPARG